MVVQLRWQWGFSTLFLWPLHPPWLWGGRNCQAGRYLLETPRSVYLLTSAFGKCCLLLNTSLPSFIFYILPEKKPDPAKKSSITSEYGRKGKGVLAYWPNAPFCPNRSCCFVLAARAAGQYSLPVPEIIWMEFIVISMQKGQSQLPHEFITRELFPYIHLGKNQP